jgi:hypothetical protein
MKIKHSDIEWARRDPVDYASYLYSKSTVRRPGGRPGFYGFWRIAALHYHKLLGDREAAINHYRDLVKNFKDTPSNQKKQELYVEYLNDYFDDYERMGYSPFERHKRVSIDVGFDFQVVGEIPRLDIIPTGGIGLFLFAKEELNWQSELRFPLLQGYLSSESGYPLEEVSVGVYCLEARVHQSMVFAREEVEAAIRAVRKAAEIIYSLKPKAS